jgi:DNA-directed RNA polymerase subunit delta
MSNINNEYKKIVQELDENISNKEELEYAKNQLYKLSMIFLEELQEISDRYEDRMEVLAANQKELETKLQKVQDVVNNIEKDIYDEEAEDTFDFEIVCPYCNNQFVTEIDELKEEVQCPECKNIIELDWEGQEEEESSCGGSCCSHCHGHTDEQDEIEDDDM